MIDVPCSSTQNHQESDSETGGGGGGTADAFTKDELRRLFQVESKTACATHDVSASFCKGQVALSLG
jgi:hypothetical protein